MSDTTHIVIVGGGITGLVAAYTLQQHYQSAGQPCPRITLLEASPRLGGKIHTRHFAGLPVDTGAEGFMAIPEIHNLCQQLAIETELITARASKTHIWTRGHLYPMPDGVVMGVPTNIVAIARSRILSLPGMLRAGMDLVLPRTKLPDDPTVKEAIGARLGQDVLNHLVEPLLAGIHSGNVNRLSLSATAPHIAALAKKNRSLILGLRTLKKAPQPQSQQAGPQPKKSMGLSSFKSGLYRLIERLQESLSGVDIRLNSALQTIERLPDGTYRLTTTTHEEITAQSVVLAVSTKAFSQVFSTLDATVAQDLTTIEHASVVVAHLAYRASAFPAGHPHITSILTPAIDGRLLKSCSSITDKWERDSNTDLIVLRCSSGRAGDERAIHMNDTDLIEAFHRELGEALGVQEHPVDYQIERWQDAFPQYNSGYQAHIQRIEGKLTTELPGIVLAGADYHGAGLSSCIKDGLQTAQRVYDYLEHEISSYKESSLSS
jgi:oxygen-dependent protoporphyrinogen oxidase